MFCPGRLQLRCLTVPILFNSHLFISSPPLLHLKSRGRTRPSNQHPTEDNRHSFSASYQRIVIYDPGQNCQPPVVMLAKTFIGFDIATATSSVVSLKTSLLLLTYERRIKSFIALFWNIPAKFVPDASKLRTSL